MTNRKLRVGVIGCGGIARTKHLPALRENRELCDVVAFCDIIEDRAVAMAKEFGTAGAKITTDYKEIAEDASIDVVHILTPNVAHAPITVDCFAAGKHVMCEKPMAHTSLAAQTMLDAWKKSGKKFTIGYQNRFRSEVQALFRACRENALGDIYFAKAHAVRRRSVPTWGVFPNKALQGGGPLIDIGTHALDLTLWMMDNYEPELVSGSVFFKMADKFEGNTFGPWDPDTYEVEDSAFGFVRMKDGATIFLEASWALNTIAEREAATTLCGTEGGAEIRNKEDGSPELIFNTAKYGRLVDETLAGDGKVAFFEGADADPAVLECRQWLECITADTMPLVHPQQAFTVTRILEAIYRSAEEKREIRWE